MAVSLPIACRSLTKRYGDLTAVDELDLEVEQGSIVGFLGPNGAGKSTVIRMVTGLAAPTSGSVRLWGHAPTEAGARRRLGYMPSDPSFYGALSGRENLDLLSRLQGTDPVDRSWALALLGLADRDLARPTREYSSGMIQKLGLVQATQHRPDLVVLDEPANRLDPLAHRRFEELVHTIAARGGTVFLSSHTLSEVQDVCESVAMVRRGRLLAVRDVAAMAAGAPRRLRIAFASPPASVPAGLAGARLEDGVLTARLPAGRIDLLRELLSGGTAVDVLIEPLTLEEAFVELYGEEPAT